MKRNFGDTRSVKQNDMQVSIQNVLVLISAVLLGAQALAVELPKSHPRIFLLKEQIPALRTRLKKNPEISKKYRWVKMRADELTEPRGSLFVIPYELETLALVYLAENRARKYLNTIRKYLEFYREPRDKKGLWATSHALRAMSMAYDWTYDELSPQERVRFGKVILATTELFYESWRHGDYNNQLYLKQGQIIFPALALSGTGVNDTRSKQYLADYENLLKRHMLPATNQVAGEDGGWHESVFYTMFFAKHFVPQLEAWRVATRENLFPASHFSRNLASFLLHTRVPHNGYRVPIGDTIVNTRWGMLYEGATMPLLASRYRDSRARHIYSQLPRSAPHQVWPYLLWFDKDVPDLDHEEEPTSRIFRGNGWVTMRSDWTQGATFSVFKSGDYYNSHQHWDENSFVISRRGRLAIDPGGARNQAGTEFHNTMLIGGPQRIHGGNQEDERHRFGDTKLNSRFDRGDIVAYQSTPYFTYVCGDATKAYPKSRAREYVRQFLFIAPHEFLIFDRVESNSKNTRKEWLVHSVKEAKVVGRTTTIQHEGGKLSVQTLYPEEVQITTANQKRNVHVTKVVPSQTSERQYFIHYLRTTDANSKSKETFITPIVSQTPDHFSVSWSGKFDIAITLAKKGAPTGTIRVKAGDKQKPLYDGELAKQIHTK